VAPVAILTAFAYIDGWDATGDSKMLSIGGKAVELDSSTFRSVINSGGWGDVTGGLKALDMGVDGWWNAATGQVDPELFAALGASNRVVTAGIAETETGVAHLLRGNNTSYQAFGQHGTLAPFSAGFKASDGAAGLVRGQLAKAKGNVSGTGVLGSVVQLGAPTSTQRVYCTVHIFSIGTSITLQLQSDTAAGFPSPTTQATIGPLTTTGGTWTTVAGPLVGETHWRLNISAITGTFNIAAALGVQ